MSAVTARRLRRDRLLSQISVAVRAFAACILSGDHTLRAGLFFRNLVSIFHGRACLPKCSLSPPSANLRSSSAEVAFSARQQRVRLNNPRPCHDSRTIAIYLPPKNTVSFEGAVWGECSYLSRQGSRHAAKPPARAIQHVIPQNLHRPRRHEPPCPCQGMRTVHLHDDSDDLSTRIIVLCTTLAILLQFACQKRSGTEKSNILVRY